MLVIQLMHNITEIPILCIAVYSLLSTIDRKLHTHCFYREVNFELEFPINSSDCKGIDNIQEGVELSFKSIVEGSPGEWIPLAFFTKQSDITLQPSIELLSELLHSTTSSFILRGYRITYILASNPKNWYSVSICGDGILEYPLQLRWLQTSYQEEEFNTSPPSDVIILDNVLVSVRNGTDYAILLQETFSNQSFLR